MKKIIHNQTIEIKNVETFSDLDMAMNGFAITADVLINEEAIGIYECIYTEGDYSGKNYLDTCNAPETDNLMVEIGERFGDDSNVIKGAVYDLVKNHGDKIDHECLTDWSINEFCEDVGVNKYDQEILEDFLRLPLSQRDKEVEVYANVMKEKFLGNEEYVKEVHGEDEFYIQKILERNNVPSGRFSFQVTLRDVQFDVINDAENRLANRS